MKQERLPMAQQESLLTLLCFDKEAAPIISSVVDVELFDSDIYREIAGHAVAFYELYREPIEDHLADALATVLEGDDGKKAELYERVLHNLYNTKDGIKREYVLNRLQEFVKSQTFKRALTEAAQEVQRGDVDKAQLIVHKSLKQPLQRFHMGSSLQRTVDVTGFYDVADLYYKIGIPGFEAPGIRMGPSPKTLFTFMAAPGRGKTWFLTQCGRFCAQQRLKVLHVTLEVSEAKQVMRYVQNIMALPKYKATVEFNKFELDDRGLLDGLNMQSLDRPTLYDKGMRRRISSKMRRLNMPIVVKEFPTGSLTITQLEAYLDQLERYEGFMPDVVLVDYADLMRIDSSKQREDTGRIYKDLRGLGVDREMAMVTATQSNRLGEDAHTLTLKHLAEDYTKAATSDMIVTYSRTPAEKAAGLGRLWLAKNRDNEDGMVFVVSHAFAMGQFSIDCALQSRKYWNILEEEA